MLLNGGVEVTKSLFSSEDKRKIRADIEKKYERVAITTRGQFAYPTGRKGLVKLGYDEKILEDLPLEVQNSYCGTGNPFAMSVKIDEGEKILDFGCGAGVDAIIASKITGDNGSVVGIDLVSNMLERAYKNKKLAGVKNLEFQRAIEGSVDLEDESIDTIISNSVINLIPEKEVILEEFYRVLKASGKLLLVDQIFTGDTIKDHNERVDSWFKWEGGAISEKVFLEMLESKGFTQVRVEGESGFNSSPRTKGILISAIKG